MRADLPRAPDSADTDPASLAGAPPDDIEPPCDPSEADDLAHRFRSGALGAVASAYSAVHGHPTSHSGFETLPDGGTRRWSVGARVAVVAAVAVVGVAAVIGVVALQGGGDVQEIAALGEPEAGAQEGEDAGDAAATSADTADGEPAPPPAAASDADAEASPVAGEQGGAPAGTVVVHVVGEVGKPGLVSVPEGARVADALTAAGGATADADLTAVNLARLVVDGEQIVVTTPGQAPPPAAGAPGGAAGGAVSGAPGTPVDLGTADAAALDALPGIGPVLAERIVTWRTDNGPFTSVDELGEVSGIGPALLAKLRDLVQV